MSFILQEHNLDIGHNWIKVLIQSKHRLVSWSFILQERILGTMEQRSFQIIYQEYNEQQNTIPSKQLKNLIGKKNI